MELNNFKMDNLRILREKKHLTQVRLSIDIEVSQELISQYEIGKTKPTIENLFKLADYFNCSIDYLLGRTDTPQTLEKISKNNCEIIDIIEKYNSLSADNKNHLTSYLNHLVNTTNK